MDKWQIASAIATIVQSAFVIVSLVFIWRQVQQQTIQAQQQTLQVKQQTDLHRMSNTQALVGLSSPFNLELIKDKQMAKFWVNGANELAGYDEIDKYRYLSLLIWWLILHENIFYQWRNGLLDEESYSPWAYDLKRFIQKQQLGLRWGELKDYFQKDFSEYVGNLI